MKKLIALVLVCMLCLAGTAFAAEWPEGLSPAKPTNLKPEVDLDKNIGYWLPFPRSGLPAESFCDVLELYMPNPDIELGEGTATLWNADGEVCVLDFSDPTQVELRDLEEVELVDLHWGSGKCLEMHLPISLKFDENYYVTMDEGVLTSRGGKVKSMPIPYSDKVDITEQYWTPMISGDYGISGLYYSTPATGAADATGATGEEIEVEGAIEGAVEGEAATAAGEPKYNPVKGDVLNFDVVLGGDVTYAIMRSENNSVYFDTLEYGQSGHVTGTITGDKPEWGVVFLDADGAVVDYMSLGAISAEEPAEEPAAEE